MNSDFPPGFRFYPTEEELVSFYLHNKLENRRPDMECTITIVDIFSFDPWQLPQMAGEVCKRDSVQWFFFCPRQLRESRGGRPSRTTPSGYWKATGSASFVYSNNRAIAVKKAMVFYMGKAPTGTKTMWKMNEYKALEEDANATIQTPSLAKTRNEFSLCRVYDKPVCLRLFDRRPSTSNTAPVQTRAD